MTRAVRHYLKRDSQKLLLFSDSRSQLTSTLNFLQALYTLARASSEAITSTTALSELYVDGFDSEQIWGQMDASTKPALRKARRKIKKFDLGLKLLDTETEDALDG